MCDLGLLGLGEYGETEANAYIREKSDEQVENLNSVSQLAEEEGKKISDQPLASLAVENVQMSSLRLRSGCFIAKEGT